MSICVFRCNDNIIRNEENFKISIGDNVTDSDMVFLLDEPLFSRKS